MKAALFEDPAVLAWARAFLAKRLGDVAPVEVGLDWPATGNKTPITLVRLPDGRRAVLRLFEKPHHLAKVLSVQRHLSARGLPVARVMGWSLASRWSVSRHYALIEELLDGRPWRDGDQAERTRALPLIGRALARFHSVRRPRAGPVFLSRGEPPAVRHARRVHERIDKLEGLDAALCGRLHEAVSRFVAALPARSSHECIHGRVNNNNFLIHEQQVGVVDLAAVCYGDAAQDLSRAVLRLCKSHPERRAAFFEAYDAEVRNVDRAFLERTLPFYEAGVLVASAGGSLRDVYKGQADRDAWREERDHAAQAALELLSAQAGT